MACNEAIYLACAVIFLESMERYRSSYEIAIDDSFNYWKGKIFVLFCVGSIISTIAYAKYPNVSAVCKNPNVQEYLPFIYMFDSLGGILLGYSIYYKNIVLMNVSMLILTNFFMLHVLHAVFAKKKPHGLVSYTISVVFGNISF